ncbi:MULTISPECIES: FAD-dependent oxidoreductase [Burkholderiaceae]|uniref:FAD-dependent oxidoreductase n=1 Tax=Burkholderiaceae TaxID=119060 RepID=UPI00141EB11B|nr:MULTISPECIES: FAD-dependent oxidoreductase [Burkholderiaceae]NIF55156.1 FAD-dependent oxidoreductase [Burkholderia sp. Ax-1724]NIF80851.1 FAD-dependent oxidoreductase [Paraburkholderia sp. Cy-641]
MQTPVLIVGAGPIGLALAGDLGFRGVPCTLIERSDGQVTQPKMDMVGVRTMEYCRRWGIVPWVHDAGYNRAYPQDCAWVTGLKGYEFGREVFPSPQDEKCPPQSPQKRERCPQNFFDPVLRRFAQQQKGVEIRYNTELVEFSETSDGVVAKVRDVKTGEESVIEASYLVGSDGGASVVRQALGIGMTGEPTLTYTTNVVFRSDNLEALHDKKPAYRYIFIGPEGTWATLVAINGRDQWRFSLVGDETRLTLTEEQMSAAIVRAVGREFDFEILSMLPWVRRQLVADSYGTKRVFIAGDAAHLTSPTGGFGMNTGIQDAVNLSWKLAATLHGWGGEHLLATYETEQRPVAIRNVAEATGNLKRMLSPRVLSPSREIFEDGPGSEAARIEFGIQYTELMKREWFSIGIHLGYMYEGSPIIVPDGTPQPPDEVSSYVQTARPGSRAPHVWLAQDESTLDLFGKEFVLMCFSPAVTESEALRDAAARRHVPFRSVDIDNEEARRLYERRLVLVRPDGQVAWRGDELPDDPLALIDTVRGSANTKTNTMSLAQQNEA